jgi:hypothetical protein
MQLVTQKLRIYLINQLAQKNLIHLSTFEANSIVDQFSKYNKRLQFIFTISSYIYMMLIFPLFRNWFLSLPVFKSLELLLTLAIRLKECDRID